MVDRDNNEQDTTTLWRLGPAASGLGVPAQQLRRLADAGVVPFTRTEGGHRRFDIAAARAALADRRGAQPARRESRPADWRRAVALAGLQEDQAWREIVSALGLQRNTPAFGILQYSVNEMLNNAIEHSGGTTVTVEVWRPDISEDAFRFRIADDGVGAFERMRQTLGVDDPMLTALELTKGKFTTSPEGHSGQGIFFTSKALDTFRLEANAIAFERDTARDDYALGVSAVSEGTTVSGSITTLTSRTMADVFGPFTSDEGFDRTRPAVRLALSGDGFVSRAEARRVMARLEEFAEVEIDFGGVDAVGQGFVDEVFRVWAGAHRETRLIPIDMNPAVSFMVRRGLADAVG